jgi:sugar/nucleoside kinase (ribokinase family)
VLAHAPARAPAGGVVVDTLGAGDVFIAAFVAYGVRAPAVAAFVHGVRAGAPAPIDEAALSAWLAFACGVAGDKVGVDGLRLPDAVVARAQSELNSSR